MGIHSAVVQEQTLAAELFGVAAEKSVGMLAYELFAAVKAERPETSPLVELYAGWEKSLQGALVQEWQGKAAALVERLRVDTAVKAVDDVLGDREWWEAWVLGYSGMLNGPMFEGGNVGADGAAVQLLIDYALGVDVDQINLAVADWAREHAGALARGLAQTDREMLRRQLAVWVEAGEDFPSLMERISGFIVDPKRARRIAVTEATGAYAEGSLITWRESDVVTGQIWNTAVDEAVCPFCGPLHQQIAELDGDVWYSKRANGTGVGLSLAAPPAHPNCRCWLSPWVGRLWWLDD